MFFHIKWGKEEGAKTLTFNANCRNILIIDKIRELTGYMDVSMMDIATEDGGLIGLSNALESKASELITPRETYVLVQVNKTSTDGENEEISYISLYEPTEGSLEIKEGGGKDKKKKK
mmetsp:Transcript_9517/g.14068  ORF Transcript_9517/g.14068 Transcript_9517/m.14068 type:complete len:118 (+) Transcript_9517:23-376(+)